MRARFAPMVGVLGLSVVACETRPTSPVAAGPKPAFQVNFTTDTHFRCYIVSKQTPQPATTAILSDQFIATDTERIDEPLELCAPTSKNGATVADTETHLTMYGAPDSLVPHLIVSTTDQFGDRTLTAVGARFLLVPTIKNGLGSPETVNHWRCYEVTGPRVHERVSLHDQFDTDTVRVERPHYFCNPTGKTVGETETSPPAPDVHLTCYEIFGPQRTEATDVDIENQFETDTFTVTSFELLCVPSAKGEVTPLTD